VSSESGDRYDTMIENSLDTGRDRFGKYSSADFNHEDAYITVFKRPEGYSIQWQTEKPLTQIFDALSEEYGSGELVKASDIDGHSYLIDPDAWDGSNYELIAAELPYSNFRIDWRPFEVLAEDGEEKSFSELTLTSNTEEFNVEQPHFAPAWRLHPLLNDEGVTEQVSRKVFDDIRFYLEERL